MWIFTRHGFFSIVANEQGGGLCVRARARRDIEAFCNSLSGLTGGWDRPRIQRTPDRDYRFRTTVSKKEFAQYLQASALSVDYPNFKSAVHGDPIRDSMLLDVWARLVRYQAEEKAEELRQGAAGHAPAVGRGKRKARNRKRRRA